MNNKRLNWKKKPDFFIVGAPKCGTTAMNAYLKEHPDVFIPDNKELHFFGSDLTFKHDRSEAAYKVYFHSWQDEKVGGEASVWYLYSTKAAEEIYQFNPEAKIIIMLRNPADMVHAHHSQTMYGGGEPITNFEEALDAEEGRRNGSIPTHSSRPPKLFYYSQVARYTEQIKRYEAVFGSENLHVIIFDDLKSDAQSVYKETLSFLGVDADFKADLRPRNKNRKYRFKSLHFLITDPPASLKNRLKSLFPKRLLQAVKQRIQKANTVRAPRKAMNQATRKRLIEIYRQEIIQLGEYLDRDFSSWLEVESSQ